MDISVFLVSINSIIIVKQTGFITLRNRYMFTVTIPDTGFITLSCVSPCPF